MKSMGITSESNKMNGSKQGNTNTDHSISWPRPGEFWGTPGLFSPGFQNPVTGFNGIHCFGWLGRLSAPAW